MEMEPCPPVIAKKLWNMVRAVLYMLRKGISKSKVMADLHLMLKRGKLAGKAMGDLMLDHHYSAAFSCHSNDAHLSFVSPRPREYEFSCSNSPVYFSYYTKRKHHNHNHHHHHYHRRDDSVTIAQKVFEMHNNEILPEASPLTLPGFGRSPMVRQLRITDSPFPLKETEEDSQVDKAAEEFIKRFYQDLKKQKRIASLQSPSPYHMWAR